MVLLKVKIITNKNLVYTVIILVYSISGEKDTHVYCVDSEMDCTKSKREPCNGNMDRFSAPAGSSALNNYGRLELIPKIFLL